MKTSTDVMEGVGVYTGGADGAGWTEGAVAGAHEDGLNSEVGTVTDQAWVLN